jgi:rhamnose transport system permease protein
LLVLLFECLVFGVVGDNFLTTSNAFEITRLSVEVGLLALALTPVIITGGIDLSVGSMMGLAAVVLGALWRDAHLPIVLAAGVALLLGFLGGGLNAFLITRLDLPPLIVTLGTFSLFRGVAEGLTRGIENYSGFSPRFLFLGQGYVGGLIPTQLLVLVVAVTGLWLVVASHLHTGAVFTRLDIRRKVRATPALRCRESCFWFTCFRALPRAFPQSSTLRIWARRSLTPAPASS